MTKSKPIILHTYPSEHGVWEIRQSQDKHEIYCTCPAWRFQKDKINRRNCKHLDDFFSSQIGGLPNPYSQENLKEV